MDRVLNTLHTYAKMIRDLQASERAAFRCMNKMLEFSAKWRPIMGRHLYRIFESNYRRTSNLVIKDLKRREAKAERTGRLLRDLAKQADEFKKRAANFEVQAIPGSSIRRDSATVLALKAENLKLRAEIMAMRLKKHNH